jgi:hypothetical protein
MNKLSSCIFKWSAEDVEILEKAKRSEMAAWHLNPSEFEVRMRLTKKELSLHCTHMTRGTEETECLIKKLLTTFDGPAGRDTLGGVVAWSWADMGNMAKARATHFMHPGTREYPTLHQDWNSHQEWCGAANVPIDVPVGRCPWSPFPSILPALFQVKCLI